MDFLLTPVLTVVLTCAPNPCQRTRFKCHIAVGDGNGHIGLGVKAVKEVVANAMFVVVSSSLLVASVIPKKLLTMTGIEDVYSSTTGRSRTRGNLAMAVYDALLVKATPD